MAQEPSEDPQLTKIRKTSEEVERKLIKVMRHSEKSIRVALLRVQKIQNVCGSFQQDGHLSLEPDEFKLKQMTIISPKCGFISFMH